MKAFCTSSGAEGFFILATAAPAVRFARDRQVADMKRIGVLPSGGDAPGMNAAIGAATRTAVERGVDVLGVRRGYAGLIEGDFTPFTARDVSGILEFGGTILESDRCLEFKTPEGRARARSRLS